METDTDDVTLVQAAQRGDRAAFATLVSRHRPLLLALCRRFLGGASLAEDAAQEATLQGMLSLESLRRPERFGPWLGGIGLNICRRWLRERSHDHWSWEALIGGRPVQEPMEWRAAPEALAEAADLARRVRRAVADLPQGQRVAVLLVYLSGLTQAEAAAQLGIPAGAVKTRLHKARATLRLRLEGAWKEEQMTPEPRTQPIPVRVVDVRRRPETADQPSISVVVLAELDGSRYLPIWVGAAEGAAMALLLERVETSRPLTYAFAASMLTAAGARLREVRIERITGDTFYAACIIEGRDGVQTVDARPSDALNLALAAGAPIHVQPAVLETSGVAAAEWDAARPRSPQGPPGRMAEEYQEGATAIVADVTATLTPLPTGPSQMESPHSENR